MESPRKVIDTWHEQKKKKEARGATGTYSQHCSIYLCLDIHRVFFPGNIRTKYTCTGQMTTWPMRFLTTENNRRTVSDKQIDEINRYGIIHYETHIRVIISFFSFNTHYYGARFFTNHEWDKLRKEWTKSMPIVFNPYKTNFQDFIPTAYVYGSKFSFIFFHCLFYFLAVVSEGI